MTNLNALVTEHQIVTASQQVAQHVADYIADHESRMDWVAEGLIWHDGPANPMADHVEIYDTMD